VIEFFARAELTKAGSHGQTVLLSLDQTDVSDRMALLMAALRVGDRALTPAGRAAEGAANRGLAGQRAVFSDFKGCSFDLEYSRLQRLVLIMALAIDWRVGVGRDEALNNPTPLEKAQAHCDPAHWSVRKLYRSSC
jgi:hypothetical protein